MLLLISGWRVTSLSAARIWVLCRGCFIQSGMGLATLGTHTVLAHLLAAHCKLTAALAQSPAEGVGTSGGGEGCDTDEGTSAANGGRKRAHEGAALHQLPPCEPVSLLQAHLVHLQLGH